MTQNFTIAALVAAALAVATPLIATPLHAHDFTAGDLTIDHPTARINIGDRPSAAYMEIINAGAADALIGATSPMFGRIELHTHISEDGVMKMRPVETIPAPAGETVTLEPGGLHLMLFEPTDALGDGGLFPVTLMFESAGAVEITVIGEKIGAGMADRGHGDHGHVGHDHGHADHDAHGHGGEGRSDATPPEDSATTN